MSVFQQIWDYRTIIEYWIFSIGKLLDLILEISIWEKIYAFINFWNRETKYLLQDSMILENIKIFERFLLIYLKFIKN